MVPLRSDDLASFVAVLGVTPGLSVCLGSSEPGRLASLYLSFCGHLSSGTCLHVESLCPAGGVWPPQKLLELSQHDHAFSVPQRGGLATSHPTDTRSWFFEASDLEGVWWRLLRILLAFGDSDVSEHLFGACWLLL